jgi:hypothetical protein
MNKLDSAELFREYYSRLDASERRQVAEIDRELNDRTGVAETQGRGGGQFNGAPTSPNIAPRAPKAPVFEKGLNSIIKSHGVMAVAKLVVDTDNAHRMTEPELMQHAAQYAATKGFCWENC